MAYGATAACSRASLGEMMTGNRVTKASNPANGVELNTRNAFRAWARRCKALIYNKKRCG